MSDDWETQTKIGSKVRGGGGGPRETVVKGRGATNAAFRAGGVSTEKKYATSNAVCSPCSRRDLLPQCLAVVHHRHRSWVVAL